MYDKIPFDIMNARETFQRPMDMSFVGEKDKFIVFYLDDIIAFSKLNEEHLKHIRQVFLKCR